MIKRKVVSLSNILTPLPIRTARSGWVFLFIDMAKIAYYGGWWFQDTTLFSNPARLAKTISNMEGVMRSSSRLSSPNIPTASLQVG